MIKRGIGIFNGWFRPRMVLCRICGDINKTSQNIIPTLPYCNIYTRLNNYHNYFLFSATTKHSVVGLLGNWMFCFALMRSYYILAFIIGATLFGSNAYAQQKTIPLKKIYTDSTEGKIIDTADIVVN